MGEDIIAKKLRAIAIRCLIDRFSELHLVGPRLKELSSDVLAEIIIEKSIRENS